MGARVLPVETPEKRSQRNRPGAPASLDQAIVFSKSGTSVIRPSHVWRCTCHCHRIAEPKPIIGQLELFEPTPASAFGPVPIPTK